MKISRRDFFAGSSGLLFTLPPFKIDLQPKVAKRKNVLVHIHLVGANDWFNTVIPYNDAEYYQARPNLAVPRGDVLPLNKQFALHPAMPEIEKLYGQGNIAILLNVGHDSPTLSHHKAIEIWQYAHKSKKESDYTWQGRYAKELDRKGESCLSFPVFNIENEVISSSLNSTKKYEFDLDAHFKIVSTDEQTDYPLSNGLNKVADLIRQNAPATIYNISMGGFDTHTNQLAKHALLLKILSQSIFAFQKDPQCSGLDSNVLTIITSEFGRSLKENDCLGTDHGLMNHALVIGTKVNRGIYGNLDKPYIDFRSLYATILEGWLNCPSQKILAGKYEILPFI